MVRRLVVKRLVEEALPVTRRDVAVVEARVEEAVERKPFKKARVVEVAFSLVPSLVQGKIKPGEEESEPLVRVKLAPTVRALKEPSAPM